MQSTTTEKEQPHRLNGRRLLSYEDLRELGIPHSKLQLWRLAREGKFPKPLKLSHARNAWIESEIQGWLDALAAKRDRQEAGDDR